MDINKSKYKSLQAKVYNSKKSVYNFDQTISNLMNSLLPRQSQGEGKNTQESPDYSNQLNELNAKLSESEKRNQQTGEAYRKQVDQLSDKVQSGDEQNLELSNSLKKAIERIYADKNRQAAAAKQGNNPSQSAEQQGEQSEQSEYGQSLEALATPSVTVEPEEAEATTEESTAAKVAKQTVAIGDYFKVGKYKYRVTNTFGIREGANTVAGREGKHSGGMDLVGYDEEGNKANMPISLTDGKIVSIIRDGDGSVMDPTKGAAGGYTMRVLMGDGKIMTYMHLGEDVWKNKANLMNKTIKRGDLLYEGDYSIGSGSQTAPHIKVRVSSLENGKIAKDHTLEENDPTNYALNGKYA
jgi:major membrane immunogen (membrane-anchored lipoprotein)